MFARRGVVTLLLLSFSVFCGAAEDQFTPLLASALNGNTQVFPGTDGRQHVVHELIMINANATSTKVAEGRRAAGCVSRPSDRDLSGRRVARAPAQRCQ